MMIDGTSVDGFFAVLAALGALVLGIANIVLLKPPVSVKVTPYVPERTVRIVTRRTLWSR
jgi:hypothetical protein